MFKIISKKKYRARIRAYESTIAALSRMMEAKDRTIGEQYLIIRQQEYTIYNTSEELSRIAAAMRELRKNKLPRDARGRFIKRNQQKQ